MKEELNKKCAEENKGAYDFCVPKHVYDTTVKELSDANKRMLAAVIALALLLALSNAWWFNYETQFADETWTYEAIYETDNKLP